MSTEYQVVVATTQAVTQYTVILLGANITVEQWRPCRESRHQLWPIRKVRFFLKKKPVEISLALSTPRGGLFCFFFKRKRWHSTMFVRRGRNTKAYALCFGVAKITRRRKFVQVCCVCIFAFFPVFFTGLVVLFDVKVVLFFFLPIVVCCHFDCVCSPALELLMLQSCCCACACW